LNRGSSDDASDFSDALTIDGGGGGTAPSRSASR
jgi:hypothetical protein